MAKILFVSFLILIATTFNFGDSQTCIIRTRILHEGDHFEPSQCFFCICRNSSLSCKAEDPATCPEPPCDASVQISTPDQCCKICPGVGSRCRFNGMSVEDGENFQLHPSGFCKCHDRKLTCVKDSLNRTNIQ